MSDGFVSTRKDLLSADNGLFSSSERRELYNDQLRVDGAYENIKSINSNPNALKTLSQPERKDALILSWNEFDPKDKSTHLINKDSYHQLKQEFKKTDSRQRI